VPEKGQSQQSFFDPEFVSPSILEAGTLPWLLARCRSKIFPPWLLQGWRGEGRIGRNAWPATVLCCLWLLRWTEEGMSRLASVKRARTDLQWRAAMGLPCDVDPPSERTMRDFEKFLAQQHPELGVPRHIVVHESIVRFCRANDLLDPDPTWATDSTSMSCYGAVLDTVRLLGDGLRQLGACWARATRTSPEELAERWELPLLLAKSTKGSFEVDWRDRDARADVVDQLAGHVIRIVETVRRELSEVRPSFRKSLLKKCRNLLRVVSNDLEPDEQGRLVIARRVAADRLISVTDPEARHGRKSNKRLFNGFKLHVLGDLDSGLIASVAVTAGNQHDAVPAHRLVRRAKELFGGIEQVLADTAYGGARVRHEIQKTLGVEMLTPPQPVARRANGKHVKADFDIDFETGTATCPAGVTTTEHDVARHSDSDLPALRYKWSREDCDACPLRGPCLGRCKAKRLLLHPLEQELRAHREAWKEPELRQRYRRRGEFERLVNTAVRHGARRARTWGLTAANLQAHAIVAMSNLAILAKNLSVVGQAPDTLAAAA